MISLWCRGMRRGSCLIGVLISCSIRSHYLKSQLLIANMPSYSSIRRENFLFSSSESPSITEQYRWLGAHGLPPISVGAALPLTPLTVWYSAKGRCDVKVTTLSEKLATRKRVSPALDYGRSHSQVRSPLYFFSPLKDSGAS